MRKQDPNGDYGRAARQRQVLAAVVHKLNSASTVFKIKDLAEVVGKYVKTDIPVSDGLALYNKLSGFDPSNIKTIKLEGEDKKLNDIYYFIPDEMSVQNVRNEILKNLGQDKTDTNSTTNTSSNSDTNSTNSSTKKKEQESPSTNANAEWLMRNHQ